VADGLDADAVRTQLREERGDLVAAVLDCADAVVAGWDGTATAEATRVTEPLGATLERAGVLETLPAVLAECVAAAGGRLRAEPVAAPPYVVVTSVGPVLRATLDEERLVVTLRAFRVERDERGPRYVRDARTVADAIDVDVV
jgi:hypothetical protein